mgnify:CR=1 FL=1
MEGLILTSPGLVEHLRKKSLKAPLPKVPNPEKHDESEADS